MGKRIAAIIGCGVVVMGAGVSEMASAKSRCPQRSMRQARQMIAKAERKGPRAVRAMVREVNRCERFRIRRNEDGIPAPTPTDYALVDAAGTAEQNGDPTLFQALEPTEVGASSEHTGPVDATDGGTPTIETDSAKVSTNVAAGLLTSCWNPSIWTTTRVYLHNVHILSMTKTLTGWCGNGSVVISTNNWGHATWAYANGHSFCPAGPKYAHGPDGLWIGNHSVMAHGGGWMYIGAGFSALGCRPIDSTQWYAVLRVYPDPSWDTYDDYPKPF